MTARTAAPVLLLLPAKGARSVLASSLVGQVGVAAAASGHTTSPSMAGTAAASGGTRPHWDTRAVGKGDEKNKGYLDPYHYNFPKLEIYHYNSPILKYTITIL
jgi:hypothetical protein